MLEQCQFSQLRYQLKRSARRRTLALQIKQGQLAVLAPVQLDKLVIDQFITTKQAWIRRHLQAQIAQEMPPDYLALGQLPLLDEQLVLQVVDDQVSAVSRDGNRLWVQLSARVTAQGRPAKIQQLLRQWYQQQAQEWFASRVRYWEPLLQVRVRQVEIKHWRQKWGCCSAAGVVSFNWRLMLAPAWVADYVVVHELAHRRHMDHSPAFWQLLHRHFPQAAAAKQWFRQHQHRLTLEHRSV